jgi:N-acetylglucosamine-6-phosphate deacetylase
MIKSFLMAKAPDKAVFVSDASPVAGLPPGNYEAFGTAVRVRENGRVENADGTYLAGSSACLLDCANFALRSGCADAELLRRLCRDNPIAALGPGIDASLIPSRPGVVLKDGVFTVEKEVPLP